MSYSIELRALDQAQGRAYLRARWESVGVRSNPMEEAAIVMLTYNSRSESLSQHRLPLPRASLSTEIRIRFF